jgi:hypothetical protein
MSVACSLGGESRSEAGFHIEESTQHEQRENLIRARDLLHDNRVGDARRVLNGLKEPGLLGDQRIRKVIEILRGSPSQAELDEASNLLERAIRDIP